jgi:diaminopimelate epimerase
MKFWKMQGCGNDFIVIDGRFDNIDDNDYSDIAKKLCERKFSIGADGFIVVKNSDNAHIKMVYYNADGSRAGMCGNGIRCFSKFVIENNIITETLTNNSFTVETLSGQKIINYTLDIDGKVSNMEVDMGSAYFEPRLIPIHNIFYGNTRFIDENISVGDREFRVSSVLMGVPHTVIFTNEEMSIDDLTKYGALIEKHSIFPEGTNVNFVQVIDRANINVQTWERGCGYTFGCGTGMSASAVIANYFGYTFKEVNVKSQGGSVNIKLLDDSVIMSGTAEKVFESDIEI